MNWNSVLVFLTTFYCVNSIPEQGKWTFTFSKNAQNFAVSKSLFNNSFISVKFHCSDSSDIDLRFEWLLRYSPCAGEYLFLDSENAYQYYLRPDYPQMKEYNTFRYYKNSTVGPCSSMVSLPDLTALEPIQTVVELVDIAGNTSDVTTKSSKSMSTSAIKTTATANRKKREDGTQKPSVNLPTSPPPKTQTGLRNDKVSLHNFLKTKVGGNFLFFLRVTPKDLGNEDFEIQAMIDMKGPHGYISAQDWPLLIFFGVMGIIYLIYGVVWLILLALSWRDLLRVQFWIGGVIALGMVEKAVFYTEYMTVNNTGQSVQGAVLFAEVVSSLKKTLARILVIIVSLGFGIVKPRLGPVFKRVIGVGIFYFIVSTIEGCMRQSQAKADNSKNIMAAQVPLAVTDAFICWWIFSSLVQTTRTLRLRRNVIKLSLYRHFTNTLIFAVLASVVYMIWSLSQHKMKICVTDWRELWVDEAFWHLLFSVILLVIMILWRPSANNQRYAFSPLLDAADDEDEEELIHDAFDGMKMRGVKEKQTNGSPKQRDGRSTIEDDLKWVEENIPSSMADKALPSLLDDSDEEIMNTKYEVNKMQ